jgi:hypothetical protein
MIKQVSEVRVGLVSESSLQSAVLVVSTGNCNSTVTRLGSDLSSLVPN